jgi:hypothetical protein
LAAAVVAGSAALGAVGEWTPEPPLAGPKVRDVPVTGARFTFLGRVRRPEGRPEEAVLKRLSLSENERAATEGVIAKRAVVLERFAIGNLDLLSKIGAAGAGGRALDVLTLLWQVLANLETVGFNGCLEDQIADVLGEESRAGFRRAMSTHWASIASERAGRMEGRARFGEWLGARLAEGGELLGQEIEAAVRRLEERGELGFRYVLGRLTLSESQRARLDRLFADFQDKHGPLPTKEEQERFFLGALGFLTEDQRMKALEILGLK